jgi:hypothetical protein
LYPLKPYLIRPEQNSEFSLTVGILKFWFHLMLSFSYVYQRFTILDCPVITPTEYMFKKFPHKGKHKWEIYCEVTRDILSEIAEVEKSNKTFKDMLEYISIVNEREVTNT